MFGSALGTSVENDPRLDKLTKQWLLSEIGTLTRTEEPLESVQWKPINDEIAKLRSWDFAVYTRKEEDLLGLAFMMFVDFGLLDRYSIKEEKLRFVTFLSSRYHSPFIFDHHHDHRYCYYYSNFW